jgi:shikimate kinase
MGMTYGQKMAEIGTAKQLILHKSVVLVGMMGAGKTAVGRTVAETLGVPFCDSDHEIEAAANMTIAEIFERDGEAFFRRKESQVIERLLAGTPGIVSTGGGAFMNPDNREMISSAGVSVWLNAPLDLLWQRVRHKETRPLLRTSDPLGTLRGLYETRVPVYALADLEVPSTHGLSLEAMARRVIGILADARPDVLETRHD